MDPYRRRVTTLAGQGPPTDGLQGLGRTQTARPRRSISLGFGIHRLRHPPHAALQNRAMVPIERNANSAAVPVANDAPQLKLRRKRKHPQHDSLPRSRRVPARDRAAISPINHSDSAMSSLSRLRSASYSFGAVNLKGSRLA